MRMSIRCDSVARLYPVCRFYLPVSCDYDPYQTILPTWTTSTRATTMRRIRINWHSSPIQLLDMSICTCLLGLFTCCRAPVAFSTLTNFFLPKQSFVGHEYLGNVDCLLSFGMLWSHGTYLVFSFDMIEIQVVVVWESELRYGLMHYIWNYRLNYDQDEKSAA